MRIVSNYQEFKLQIEFNQIIADSFLIFESEGKWIDDRTYQWDLRKDKKTIFDRLKNFISKIPTEKIGSYFIELMNKIKSIPAKLRKELIFRYCAIFLSVVSANQLFNSEILSKLDPEIKKDVVEINTKSSFTEAQKLVKSVEAGFSSDRKDPGNWIDVPGGKRFVGTNHGISAPILAEYLGKLPKKEDMLKLSYQTAVKIYKKKYWDKQNLSLYNNQSVANIIYDGCVNQGISAMKEIITNAMSQMGLEIRPGENPFSESIIYQANQLDQEKFHSLIRTLREKRYREAGTFETHGKGWLNRLNQLSYGATKISTELT